MATASSERLSIAGRIAITKRNDPDADLTELQRELKTVRLADHIRAAVETAPLPTPEQLERLRALLGGGGS
ncbi:hypothetical protein OHA61_33945 [Streptomyces sp. NBC_00885]|uniref:hypothetical protein n=1 Tax=Streptomyces sp. NBC_00885 TaxID=2975857 RepID=UPI00386BE618|nr:hypothetical protein OHA61_33945 [Streptomyces sp. NBC_00885]